MRRCIPSPHGPSAHGPCMVRRRRITTACFLDVIRAPCGGARSRRGTGGSYCPATALARGWPRPAPPACPRRGSERSRQRRRAGACAGVKLADAAGLAALRRRGRRQAARRADCVRPYLRRSRPHNPDPTVGRGPGVDGISFAVHPGR